MHLRSLRYRTDLIFARYDGIVEDLGDAVRVVNPRNPAHYYGNILIMERPPRQGDLVAWETRFAREIGTPEGGWRHVLFGWDEPGGDAGDPGEFLEAGYTLEENVVMAAPCLKPPRRVNRDAEIRPLRDTDEEWALAVDNQVAAREERWEESTYRAFKEAQMTRYRAMTRAGLGFWYGAFVDGRIVADMGVFAHGELARFQAVGTHPEYRGRGLCGTLTHVAREHAREALGVPMLVIVADDHYYAKDIYRSVGFEPLERQAALLRMPR